jgi:hypothetical protein
MHKIYAISANWGKFDIVISIFDARSVDVMVTAAMVEPEGGEPLDLFRLHASTHRPRP